MYTDLRRLYYFCASRGLCIRIHILRFKKFVRTDTSSSHWAACTYGYGFCALSGLCIQIRLIDSFDVLLIQSYWILRLVRRSDDLILRFVNSFNPAMIWSWGSSIRLTFMQTLWLTARKIRSMYVIFVVLLTTICTFWLDRLMGPSSGFRRDIISALFMWFNVQLLPRTVSFWAIL